MKVRVKLSGTARAVDIGEADQCTLSQLQEKTADVFGLRDVPFTLSLNKQDALSGEQDTLSQLGIVPGDLIFVLCTLHTAVVNHNNNSANKTNDVNASSSSSSSSCASNGVSADTPIVNDVTCQEDGAVQGQGSDQELTESLAQTTCGYDDVAAADNQMLVEESASEERQSLSPCPLEDPEVNRCLQEPMLCRESTLTSVPALLRDVFMAADCGNTTEALWAVLHTLMLEVGFRPSQGDDLSLKEGWKRGGFYKQEYCHLSVPAQHSCCLIGVPMGNILIVHGVTSGDPPLKTEPHQLKVSDYVHDSNIHQDVCSVYKNLERLSRVVKDLICEPLMSQLSEVCGFAVSVGLLSLSYELKLKVLSYLSAGSLCQVGQVCRGLSVAHRDPCLWRRLFLREFGQNGDNSLNKNWYQLYKEAYQQRKERRRLSRHRQHNVPCVAPWLHPPPGHFPPLIPRPYPGGVIGGDYDLNPEFASNIPHPLIGRPRPGGLNPFLPAGPGFPGGSLLPRPRFDDPFGPGGGPNPHFMSLASSTRPSSRSSAFKSLGGPRFF